MTPLQKFGKFVVEKIWDEPIEHHLLMQNSHWNSPEVQELQGAIVALPGDQKALTLKAVRYAVYTSLHYLLHGLQEAHDLHQGIEVLVDGKNVAELSDMLHGEFFGEDGSQNTASFQTCGSSNRMKMVA
jgi:hypothetical protein